MWVCGLVPPGYINTAAPSPAQSKATVHQAASICYMSLGRFVGAFFLVWGGVRVEFIGIDSLGVTLGH